MLGLRLAFLLLLLVSLALALVSRFQRYPFKKTGKTKFYVHTTVGTQRDNTYGLPMVGIHLFEHDTNDMSHDLVLRAPCDGACTLEMDDYDGPLDHDQEWFFRAYIMLPERGLDRWCFCAHVWMMDPKRNDLPGLHGEHVVHLNFDEQYWTISPYDNRFEFKPCPYYPIGQPRLFLNDEEKARAKANGTWVAEYDPEYDDPWFEEATLSPPSKYTRIEKLKLV